MEPHRWLRARACTIAKAAPSYGDPLYGGRESLKLTSNVTGDLAGLPSRGGFPSAGVARSTGSGELTAHRLPYQSIH